MANYFFKSNTTISFIAACILILATLVRSQEFSKFGEQCGGCWNELDGTVDNIVRNLAESYKQRAREDLLNEDEEAFSLIRGSPHEIFRRSAAVSTSLECRACWIVLNRLKTHITVSDSTEQADYGRLVKKKSRAVRIETGQPMSQDCKAFQEMRFRKMREP